MSPAPSEFRPGANMHRTGAVKVDLDAPGVNVVDGKVALSEQFVRAAVAALAALAKR